MKESYRASGTNLGVFVMRLRKASFVKRCGSMPRLFEESVAHHECYAAKTAYLFFTIYANSDFTKKKGRPTTHAKDVWALRDKVVAHLLFHDDCEIEAGDIPYLAKNLNEDTREANATIEDAGVIVLLKGMKQGVKNAFGLAYLPDHKMILNFGKLFDMFDFLVWAKREYDHGNRSAIVGVNNAYDELYSAINKIGTSYKTFFGSDAKFKIFAEMFTNMVESVLAGFSNGEEKDDNDDL